MKSRKSIVVNVIMLGMMLWAPVVFAQGMMGEQKGNQQMMGTTSDMSKKMNAMSQQMLQGKMDPEMMKKMGDQMQQMSEMMGTMSGMMGPGMMNMMMNGDMQKKMNQMRKQMDTMIK